MGFTGSVLTFFGLISGSKILPWPVLLGVPTNGTMSISSFVGVLSLTAHSNLIGTTSNILSSVLLLPYGHLIFTFWPGFIINTPSLLFFKDFKGNLTINLLKMTVARNLGFVPPLCSHSVHTESCVNTGSHETGQGSSIFVPLFRATAKKSRAAFSENENSY